MKKIILIPDSFKGTMSSSDICKIMKTEIHKHYPDCRVVSIPVADGGEGSVECFLEAVGGERITLPVSGPLFDKVDAFYGLINGGKTAVIEMAACAGLPLIKERKNPLTATTYGVGEIILDAAARGAKEMIVGLGGSATNDGGCGAAAAVGVRFFNEKDEAFIPTGGTLGNISRIDLSGKSSALNGIAITVMCDIDNPMFGPEGAAYVFGPQKGASPEMVRLLDNGLRHLAQSISCSTGKHVHEIPGSGAAGAMGAGMLAFFDARLQMGIESVLDTVRFDEELQGADMVVTGEGRIDSQSLRGKVVIGVARRAKRAGTPVVVIAGDIEDNLEAVYEEGVSAIFSINRVAVDFTYAQLRAKSDLALTVDNLIRFCRAVGA